MRQAAILRAARDSFAEHGYETASLRDIAARAGISHQGLLHHFPSKQVLLIAVLEQRDEEEIRSAAVTVQAGKPDPLRARRFLEDVLARWQKDPELMRLRAELAVAASRPDHPAQEYFARRYADGREVMSRRLASGAAGPLADGMDGDTAAILLLAVLEGLQVQWLLDPDLDIIEALRRFRDLMTGPLEDPPA